MYRFVYKIIRIKTCEEGGKYNPLLGQSIQIVNTNWLESVNTNRAEWQRWWDMKQGL